MGPAGIFAKGPGLSAREELCHTLRSRYNYAAGTNTRMAGYDHQTLLSCSCCCCFHLSASAAYVTFSFAREYHHEANFWMLTADVQLKTVVGRLFRGRGTFGGWWLWWERNRAARTFADNILAAGAGAGAAAAAVRNDNAAGDDDSNQRMRGQQRRYSRRYRRCC